MPKFLKFVTLTLSLGLLVSGCGPSSHITTNSDGTKVYRDDFSNLRAWNGKNDNKWTANDVLVVQASPKTGAWMATNRDFHLKDFDATIEARVTSGAGNQGAAGLIFWCKNIQDTYSLVYDTTGEVYIARWFPKQPISILPDGKTHPCAAIKKGLNQWNTLRLIVKDGKGVCYVNGQKALEFEAKPSDDERLIGVTAMRSDSGVDEGIAQAEFRNLVVEY